MRTRLKTGYLRKREEQKAQKKHYVKVDGYILCFQELWLAAINNSLRACYPAFLY